MLRTCLVGWLTLRTIVAVQVASSPIFTNRQFLLISSATEKMIAYTELENFRAKFGRTFPLVDTGLVEPRGIAFDRKRSNLYVADYGAQALYRYKIMLDHNYVHNGSKMTRLIPESGQLTLLEGVNTSYVHVDSTGNLYYTDFSTNSVNKIEASTLESLFEGSVQGSSLEHVDEKTLASVAGAQENSKMSSSGSETSDTETAGDSGEMRIRQIYDGSVNSSASLPGPLCTSGQMLFWGNTREGSVYGSLIRGEAEPHVPALQGTSSEPAPFPTAVVAYDGDNATGLTITSNMVLWSDAKAGSVYAIQKADTSTASIELATGLGTPYGLEWDGDNTAYVADQDAGVVWSIAVGRFVEDVPATQVVLLNGAAGVALFSDEDAAFSNVYKQSSSSWLSWLPF
mmetsp:Transcript_64342/g.119603  ORF Transcript_64342/g.119603 Transcript_64342/m.119603 type:complete len:399 (+) Transcript_64342:52-1248(+)